MSRGKSLFNKIYSITILLMLFMTGLAGIQAMAATESDERKVHWESSTKDEEIKAPDGLTGDGGKWESPTFTSSDNGSNDKDIATKPMTAANEYAAIAAALAGVLAISASKKSTNEGLPTVSEGNGIWVPETDRDAVINMINKAASKEYYIDANGFVKEVAGTVDNLNKSSTYSSVLDRLISGDNKVVIGVGDGWVSSGEAGLEANAFTGNNSGITVGDNGTPQVVIVSGKDMPESTADMTLAHELTHALRGEEGIRSINTAVGMNKDEEAHVIELENKIRGELGYVVRRDGDTSDGGDGSYGKYSDSSEDDWYNRIDQLQKSTTLSGNPYSYSIFGAVVAAVVSAITSAIIGSSSSSGSSRSRHKKPKEWGSNYDDSVWGSVVGVVSNFVTTLVDWNSKSKPKRDWDSFWNAIPKALDTGAKVLSQMGTAISMFTTGILNIPNIFTLGTLFNVGVQKQTGWVKDKNGEWYYYNSDGVMQTGWIQDNGKWYYLDSLGKMAKDTLIPDKDGLYYVDEKGKMLSDQWKKYNGKWYYLDEKGKVLANEWKNDEGKWYYFDASGQIVTNNWIKYKDKDYYLYSEGVMATGWMKTIDDEWYYFDPDSGEMQTGWFKDKKGKWYCLDDSGVMKTGWIQDKDGKLYYLDETKGYMKTGWVKDNDGKWHYYDNQSGKSEDGWINDNGTYYYLDSDGDVKKGWFKYGESWYHLDGSGAMQTGWLQDNGNWYYFNSDGAMQTGEIEDKGKRYYFNSSGQLQATYCDSQIVYQTDRKPGEEKDGSPAGDSTYGDYSKERILSIDQNGVSFSIDNFLNGGIENLDEDQLFSNLKELSTIFSAGDLQDVAEDMINHFRYGDGAEYSNDVLTERVRAHASTQAYADKMLKGLKEGLAINKGDLSVINTQYWRDKLTQGTKPSYSTWGDKAEGLTFCINDTWGNTIEVKDYHFDGENYSGTMKIKIYDEFGLNESDIDNSHPFHNLVGFRSWFLLQHYNKFGGKYKPFTTVVDLEYPFEGNINVLDPIEAQVTDGAAVRVTD